MKTEYRDNLIEDFLQNLGIDSENKRKRLMYGAFRNTLDCEEININNLITQFQLLWNEAFAAGYIAAHEPNTEK